MSSSHSGTSQSILDRDDYADVQDHTEILSDSPRGIPVRRRGSASATTGGFLTSERTPLLQPTTPIPRPHEPTDDGVHDIVPTEQISTPKMFQEELRILTKYSLPVLGYV